MLTALLILALLSLLCYRGLSSVLDARARVADESTRWRAVAAFFDRFAADVHLAAPYGSRTADGELPAWTGAGAPGTARLEFSRFATAGGLEAPRRLAYILTGRGDIELWLWPTPDPAPTVVPARYPVLSGVKAFDLAYLGADLVWRDNWPLPAGDRAVPRAVRVRVVLTTGETILRVFALWT
jgi:type II secretion system protein J